jgi:vacuolar-type H+-ATPase subunit F/Vma7
MMMNAKQSGIAVIGGSNLTTLLRLAGVSHFYTIEDDSSLENSLRETMTNVINNPAVSIIAIQSDYAVHVRDMIDRVVEDKRLTPVFIEVPSGGNAVEENAAEYYRAFVRKFVGFDIEI